MTEAEIVINGQKYRVVKDTYDDAWGAPRITLWRGEEEWAEVTQQVAHLSVIRRDWLVIVPLLLEVGIMHQSPMYGAYGAFGSAGLA